MWLTDFLRLFPEATKRMTGKHQRLHEIEEELEQVLAKTYPKVHIGQSEWDIISNSDAWTPQRYWPDVGPRLVPPVRLPDRPWKLHQRESAVKSLHGRVMHIEVVSVLLRFIYPKEFGIISTPIVSLLNISPRKSPIGYYLSYLGVLRALRNHYKDKASDGALDRVADIDMALWSAAHLREEYPELRNEMEEDRYFQEVRLSNLLQGIGTALGKQSTRDYLLLARALMPKDHRLAGLIAGWVFGQEVMAIAAARGISALHHTNVLFDVINALDAGGHCEALGLDANELHWVRRKRNVVTHPNPREPLPKEDVERMIDVAKLLQG